MNNEILDTQTKSENQKTLTFLHDSLRDYFAAEHIQDCWTKEEKEARRYVRKRRYNPVWQETIVFLAGLLENPDALLYTLTKPLWWVILTAQLGPNDALVTAGKCLGVRSGNLTRYGQKLLNRLIQMADPNNEANAKFTAIEALAPIHSREAIEGIVKCFTKSFIYNDVDMGHIIAREVAKNGSEEAQLALIRALGNIDENVSLSTQRKSIMDWITHYFKDLNSVKIGDEAVKVCFKSKNIEIREAIFRWFVSVWHNLLSLKTFPGLIMNALYYESAELPWPPGSGYAGRTCWRRFPSETEQFVLQLLEDPERPTLLKESAIFTTYYTMSFSSKLQERLKQILLSSSEPSIIRGAAVWPVFYKCNSIEEKKEILEKCVQDSDSNVRIQAANSASWRYIPDYDEFLFQLLCDDEPKVSEAAANALIKNGASITIEKLKNLLNTNLSQKASTVIRNTIEAIEQTLLFSVECSEFRNDLDNNTISEELRQKFENNGISLPQYAQVWIIEQGSRWGILGKLGKNGHYLVRKEENKLNIYEKPYIISL